MTQPDDALDSALEEYFKMSESKDRSIRIEELAVLLGGSCQRITTANSMGRQSKKIVVEYDVKDK